jgi:hypothetical protein
VAQAQPLTNGSWVQYNPTYDSPRAAAASGPEQGIGQIKQSMNAEDGQYYQVVWNPGDMNPRSAWYHTNQLTQLTQQQAQQIAQDMANGQAPPNQGTQGSNYQQPTIPTQALPGAIQNLGPFQPAPAGTTPAASVQANVEQPS